MLFIYRGCAIYPRTAGNSVTALQCRSGDDNTFISAGADKFIATWDIAQGKCTSVLKGHADTVFAVVPFGADNTRLVSCSKDIKLWDMEEGIDDEMYVVVWCYVLIVLKPIHMLPVYDGVHASAFMLSAW